MTQVEGYQVTEDRVGWNIVFAAGRTFVGRRREPVPGFTPPHGEERARLWARANEVWPQAPVLLSPVYSLEGGTFPNLVPGPDGRPQVVMVGYGISVHPILSLASLKSLPIPDGSIVTPLEDLDDFDRRSILAAINQCETQLRENRAKRAGIVTATPQAAKASIEAARKAGVRLPGDAGADGEPIVRLK